MRILILSAFLALQFPVNAQKSFRNIAEIQHPRLFLHKNEEISLKNVISSNNDLKIVDKTIKSIGDSLMKLPVLEHKIFGHRLLLISRDALRRIFVLSYLYRIIGEEKYLEAAKRDLLTVSLFKDWNPTHFLDVAEMTLAVAIGYDWLYENLNTSEKEIVKSAIIEKGLKPSLDSKYNRWLNMSNNWNQVCNAGLTLGAMAIYEENPDLADNIISRAIETVKISMDRYSPDGTYPEGYSYWAYGTAYNVILLDALEKLIGNDFGLSKTKGFMETAEYFQHLMGTSGLAFNYSDGHSKPEMASAMFWFAKKLDSPSLVWNELQIIRNKSKKRFLANDRLSPLIVIWGKNLKSRVIPPSKTFWSGSGENPVAMMRTSWTDKDAIYLGFKLGSPSIEHAHMDVGSFVFDALGERWAMELGQQSYEGLEARKINLWNYSQNSSRWTIFRYNNFSHNTLTFDEELQNAKGDARLLKISDNDDFRFATSDLTDMYKGKATKILRGVGIKDGNYGIIQDEITSEDNPVKMRWTMTTPAGVQKISKKEILLVQNGKKLLVRINSKTPFEIKTWDTNPKAEHDAPNPNTLIVGFEANIEPQTKTTFVVQLIPWKNINKSKVLSLKYIDEW